MSSIKNLHYKIGPFFLDIPELELPDSQVTAITGASGSGKTSFLKVLIGLYQPHGWQWHFRGEDLHKLAMPDRRLGVVFQSYDLFPHLTAEENVQLILRARHKPAAREAAVLQMNKFKEQLALEKCWSTKAEYLSGGEKQRVALLRALISDPRMLLLDEPFAALDQNVRAEARTMVKNIVSQLDIPVYLVTHDPEDVKTLAQHQIKLENGRLS